MGTPNPEADGLRRYGLSHHGVREDTSRCVVEVAGRERWPSYYQCNKPRGHGPDGLYCKTHDPAAVAKRGAASMAAHEQKRHNENRPQRQQSAYRKALEEIANGHNDPRAVAAEALKTD